jgi:hypothetical protein
MAEDVFGGGGDGGEGGGGVEAREMCMNTVLGSALIGSNLVVLTFPVLAGLPVHTERLKSGTNQVQQSPEARSPYRRLVALRSLQRICSHLGRGNLGAGGVWTWDPHRCKHPTTTPVQYDNFITPHKPRTGAAKSQNFNYILINLLHSLNPTLPHHYVVSASIPYVLEASRY